MITNFKVSPNRCQVSWENEEKAIRLEFKYKAFANHVEYLDEVIIQSDARESGSRNLAIYTADGVIKACPEMPALKHEVSGVYSVWFDQGNRYQTVVLMTDEFSPYDTACTFDLETYEFSKFHPTK
ncbi:MAG: hypothetical protein ACRYG7_15155 [Janthinobacterium lividum]